MGRVPVHPPLPPSPLSQPSQVWQIQPLAAAGGAVAWAECDPELQLSRGTRRRFSARLGSLQLPSPTFSNPTTVFPKEKGKEGASTGNTTCHESFYIDISMDCCIYFFIFPFRLKDEPHLSVLGVAVAVQGNEEVPVLEARLQMALGQRSRGVRDPFCRWEAKGLWCIWGVRECCRAGNQSTVPKIINPALLS